MIFLKTPIDIIMLSLQNALTPIGPGCRSLAGRAGVRCFLVRLLESINKRVEPGEAADAICVGLEHLDNLTAVEEAESLQRLMEAHCCTQEEVGNVVSRPRTTVRDILAINKLPQGIRDECRGDRKVPRQTLIEIGRKKQERAMITAWNAWREKQSKTKATRPLKDPNDPASARETVQKTMTTIGKLASLDTAAWTDDEREGLRVSLVDLKTKIDDVLNPNSGTA